MTAVLEVGARVTHLTYRYPSSRSPALVDVDFDLVPGLTAVAGPSGSGKSTLLRLWNGLVPHFHGGTISGEVLVGERDALRTSTATLARAVGFVFQDPEAQFVRAVVADEVAFALENTAMPRHPMLRRVEEAMAATGILGLAGRTIASLSGGERQRVAIASAMALRPGILVLDEPTAQLDPAGSAAVLAAAAGLARAGTSVLVAEHRVGPLLSLADRLAVVDGGGVGGPAPTPLMLDRLADPPPLLALARALNWNAAPTSFEAARELAPRLRKQPPPAAAGSGVEAWTLRDCELSHRDSPVLAGVNVAGIAGQVTVLFGPNGAGKTTLLRAIAGLHRPRSGTAWRRAGRVAYLPQDPGDLLHRPTLQAEVDYTLRRAASNQEGGWTMRRLGLVDLAGRYPGDMSSGQRQRAALAAILAGDPALVLLDEPTRGMDGDARDRLGSLLREMAEAGTSVVVATHDVDLAAQVADQVIVVDQGAARASGAPRSILSGSGPYATDIGRLYPGGPTTVNEVLGCL